MPYKHREPVPESEMQRDRYSGHHTICQTLRDIYAMTEDPEIRLKCRIGVSYAKAMHEKLKWYKAREEQSGKSLNPDTVAQL